MKLDLFVYLCRTLVRCVGDDESPPVVWASNPDDYEYPVMYQDEKVQIIGDVTLPSLYVEMLEPHRNPVICIDRKGEMYRHHGERHMLDDHIVEKVTKVGIGARGGEGDEAEAEED